MKTTGRLLFAGIFTIIFTGCQEKVVDTYLINVPVYMDRNEFKNAVTVSESTDIIRPGKIYFKDGMIFINEVLKGIHVIDNNDPSSPVFVSFIEIPGNVDMAIKDSILYADSYIDLVALNIEDIHNIREVGRVDSIFPYSLPPLVEENGLPMGTVDPNAGIVVGWETKEVKEVVSTGNSNFRMLWNGPLFYEDAAYAGSKSEASGDGGMSVGIAGSMARFTLLGNFLYTVDQSNLKVFDIDELSSPLLISDEYIGWGVETIFPYQNKLFFGTQTGLIIYGISNPADPVYISTYFHVTSCDPVVVEDNHAYVTLRAGNLCGEATSQLDVIDISNIQAPKWVQSYPLQEPYGLGIDNRTLFVCDGPAGLKVFNAVDPKNLVKTAWFSDVQAYDVIPFNGILMMIGEGGLYQYSYSGSDSISLLSHIPIQKQ